MPQQRRARAGRCDDMAADELTTHDIAGARESDRTGAEQRDSSIDEGATESPSAATPEQPAAAGAARAGDAVERTPQDDRAGEISPPPQPDAAATAGRVTDGSRSGDLPSGDADRIRSGADATAGTQESLLPADETERLTSRWQEIQAGFVDEPRR